MSDLQWLKGPNAQKQRGNPASPAEENLRYRFLRDDYGWIPDFLRLRDAQAELETCRVTLSEIFLEPVAKADRLKSLRRAHAAHQERRRRELVKILASDKIGDGDVFRYPHFFRELVKFPYFSWEEIERAAEDLADGLDPKIKFRRTKAVEIQVEKLETVIKKLSPAKFFDKAQDLRQSFLDDWKSCQRRLNAPCGPRGIALSESVDKEQRAWKDLGLDGCVNDNVALCPHNGVNFTA